MMNKLYAIEPIAFLFTKTLFMGIEVNPEGQFIIIDDVKDAYTFAFDQNLPEGYHVWQDVIENLRGSMRKEALFQEAYSFVNESFMKLQAENMAAHIEYRKKKLKKTNNRHDDFLFSEARDDAGQVLSTVAINRYLNNDINTSLLENLFKAYQSGGWPCGMKGDNLLVFNPQSIKL